MKRSVYAMMTAAAVVGCQSPGSQYSSTATAPSSQVARAQMAAKPTAVADGRTKIDPNIQLVGHDHVGYNHGWGASQNNNFRQRVAGAVPSVGGAVPGAMPGPGGFPPGGPGGPVGPMGPGSGVVPGPHGGMHGSQPNMLEPHMGGMAMGGQVPLGPRFITGRTQVRFVRPTGMKVAWQSGEPDGSFTPPQLEAPARYNFVQARIYRLKLTDIQGRAGLELYPTLEVYPGNAKVDPYLAHNPVPVEFSEEDFDQVQAGNYVTKVIYLPDPKYQELAIAGVETLVSTRLDPGVDPVAEANRRGAILAVVRLGSVDLEMPHSPELFGQPGMIPPPGMMPPGMGMPGMIPPGMVPPGMGANMQGAKPATSGMSMPSTSPVESSMPVLSPAPEASTGDSIPVAQPAKVISVIK